MDATQLRPGNIVTIENPIAWANLKGREMMVIAIQIKTDVDFPKSNGSIGLFDFEDKQTYSQFSEFISGIPLTAELLLDRCGFEPIFESKQWMRDKTGFAVKIETDGIYYYGSSTGPIKLDYLHTLQNLYQPLNRGTELTIKP